MGILRVEKEIAIVFTSHKENPFEPLIKGGKQKDIGAINLTFEDGTVWRFATKFNNPNSVWSVIYNDAILNKLACGKTVTLTAALKDSETKKPTRFDLKYSLKGSTKALKKAVNFTPDCKNGKGIVWKISKKKNGDPKKLSNKCGSDVSGKARWMKTNRKPLDNAFKPMIDECRFNQKGQLIQDERDSFVTKYEWRKDGQIRKKIHSKNGFELSESSYIYDPYGNLIANFSKRNDQNVLGMALKARIELSVYPWKVSKEEGFAVTKGKHNFYGNNKYKEQSTVRYNKNGDSLPIRNTRTENSDGGYTNLSWGTEKTYAKTSWDSKLIITETRTYNKNGDDVSSSSSLGDTQWSYSKKDSHGNWTKRFSSSNSSKQVTIREITYW